MGPKKQIGKYQRIKAIGKGSFGEVWLVSDPARPEPLVLKEVSLKGLTAKERKATMNEVAVLKRLLHDNIISFVSSEVIDGSLCVLMEYAPGGDLAKLIVEQKKTGKKFPEEQIRRFLAEIVSAMAYCHHELHLLHRDLKPANIFIGKGGKLQLGDFGISKTLAASKAFARTQCGTPLYMSPELASGACYDRSADTWAVGCVLYELMTLTPPWVDQVGNGGITGLMRCINGSSLNLEPLRAHYSPELVALLSSLLAKPASARPSLGHVLTLPLVQAALPPPPPPARSAGSDPPMTSKTTATESVAASTAASAAESAAARGGGARFPAGSRVMVRRTSGKETIGIVDKHDASLGIYSLTLVTHDGKVEGVKKARESDLREAESELEKHLVDLHGRLEQQARKRSKPAGCVAAEPAAPVVAPSAAPDAAPASAGAAARENLMAAAGGADAHAAAQVLQRSFQRRRAAVPNRFGLTPVKEASTPARTPAKTSEKQQLSPAALLAQQHVRQQHEQQQRRLRLQQQRLQQLQRQQALHQPPSAAGSEGVRRPVESLKDQQRRLAGQVLGPAHYQRAPFKPLV